MQRSSRATSNPSTHPYHSLLTTDHSPSTLNLQPHPHLSPSPPHLTLTLTQVIARDLCVDNAASVLQAADSYQVLTLRATTIDFMVSNFGAVVQSEAFKDLVKLESRGLVLRFLEEAAVRLQPREA